MDAGVIAVVGFTPWLLEGNVRLLPLSVVGENLRNDLQMIHEATIMVRRLLRFIYEPQLLILHNSSHLKMRSTFFKCILEHAHIQRSFPKVLLMYCR